ncbi:MAG: ORF6N domain-containing protein [Candidatus Margulisbacteria bacterium]|nr:ORF6N domain-containing protein [Candidatus Margulisiibacteriota bacterium]
MDKLIPIERIENRIYLIRGTKVMLDKDLATLYGVKTKNLNKGVVRNRKRFPIDFMFQLNKEEYDRLRFQIGTLKQGQHSKYLPYVFTENGVAMLSSILRSERAIEVNIQIMRAFTHLRQLISSHKELAHKINELEKKHSKHEIEITTVFKLLKKLMEPVIVQPKPAKPIGFLADRKDK